MTKAKRGAMNYSAGLPGTTYTVFAPARTSTAIIDRINQEIVRFLKTQEAKDKFLAAGIETVGSSPQELGAPLKLEMTRLGKVIRDAGIREESVN